MSAFVRSGYFDLMAAVQDDQEVIRLLDTGRARAVLVIPARFGARASTGERVAVQVLINGDNANTATTVMGYVVGIVSAESARYQVQARVGSLTAPLVTLEPRVWYNPELRSALFLVPGLIAYIAMLTAVVSTALSVVREKEAGTMEQIRMAPIGPVGYVLGKTVPYFVISLASAIGVVAVSMALFDLPMRGSWVLLVAVGVAVPRRRAGHGPADLDSRRIAAGGVPAGAAVVVPADADAVRVHLPDLQHAGVPPGGHQGGPGPLFPDRAAWRAAQGGGHRGAVARAGGAGVIAVVLLGLASARLQAAVGLNRMRRLGHLFRKELIELRRDPRLFGIVIIAPIVQLTLLAYAATTDVRDVPVLVMDEDQSTESRALVERFDASANFTVVAAATSTEELETALNTRRRGWL